MAEWMICPICGKKFPIEEYEILDNGNPACPECVAAEREEQDD